MTSDKKQGMVHAASRCLARTLPYCVEPPSSMRLGDERCAALASSTITSLDLAVAGILLGYICYNLRRSCDWFLKFLRDCGPFG